MKKQRVLLWLIPLVILMLLIPFIVPSALPYAGAESADLPAYAPVELANPHPDPLPMPDPKGKKDPYGYAAHEDGFIYDEATKAAWEYRDGTVYVKIDVRTIGKTKVNSTTPYCWHQEANQQNHLFYVDELLHTELVLKFMVQKYFGLGVPVKKNHV